MVVEVGMFEKAMVDGMKFMDGLKKKKRKKMNFINFRQRKTRISLVKDEGWKI